MRTGLLIISAILSLSACTNPHTPAGHEGFVKEEPLIIGNGGYVGSVTGPGNFGFSFWNNVVENVDFRPKTYPEVFEILAKDELNIKFNYQTIIKVKGNSIKEVVEDFSGKDFYQRYIKEPLRSMVRRHMQQYDSRAVKSKRSEVSTAVLKDLREYLKDTPFVVVEGVVGNINYPKVVTGAVEKKLAAKQLLDEKETQKLIAIKDAQIEIEKARGIAKAQEIINKTLTDRYLQHEAIGAQLKMASSPNHTTVYIPSGANGLPVVKTLR
jgi:regulator of protease activity HflC (stomatin/prohibitin superfamily)